MTRDVLVVGGGGRCHAIVEQLRKSPKVDRIYAARGNAGIARAAECIDIAETDIEGLLAFAKKSNVDLTVVGPEIPLSMGIADRFRAEGLRIFGPTQSAARIESSKTFAKDLMKRYGIPTAAYETFDFFNDAVDYAAAQSLPIVIKYDGLAAGKGVVVAETRGEAQAALEAMLIKRQFGTGKVIIEEYLDGSEFSFMCFVNGSQVFPMETAQDYKRAYDGNKGPNTGGMGAYSPVPFVSQADCDFALAEIMQKTAQALADEGCPFCGVLYGGLIKTPNGIKVIEFNARFGDPETEVVLPRLVSDFYDILEDVTCGRPPRIAWSSQCALGVTLAARGYPAEYEKGCEIKGLEDLDTPVFHMGTQCINGRPTTNGGRVLLVTALADTLEQARSKVYTEIQKIDCPNLFYRTDIGVEVGKI